MGYLGYELRDECDSLPPKYDSPLPDAAFFLADRFVAFDHVERQAYIVGVYEEERSSRSRCDAIVGRGDDARGLAPGDGDRRGF